MYFSILYKIAVNNIKKYKLQSLFIFLALIISQSSLIISLSIINGFNNEFINNFLKFEPDIKIMQKKNSPISFITDTNNILSKIKKYNCSDTIETEGVLKANGFVAGVKVLGISKNQKFYKFSKFLESGKDKLNENDCICGSNLAKKLNLISENSRVKIVTSDGENYFNLTGVFHTGLSDYDTYYIFVNKEKLLKMMDLPRGFSSYIDIRGKNLDEKKFIEKFKDYRIETQKERNSAIFLAAKIEKISAFIVISFMVVISILLIISLFLFQIMRLKKEIALMKILGYSNGKILSIFYIQIVIFYIISTLITLIFSSGILYYLNFKNITLPENVYLISKIPIFISFYDISSVLIFTLICIIAGTIIPFRILKKIDPSNVISGRD